MSVLSHDSHVDAVGACVGMNGSRVNIVVEELGNEKIDIINWDEDPAVFIEHALSPAKVVSVKADIEESARVVVPDYQLSLAIGREGQNARLAARLTGYRIDIKSESQMEELENMEEQDDVDEDENLTDDIEITDDIDVTDDNEIQNESSGEAVEEDENSQE